MVLTNGVYASEVWDYTRVEMDRLEKPGYFGVRYF